VRVAKGYVLVEGHGEKEAVPNLLNRLWQDLELPPLTWAEPIRCQNLHIEQGVRQGCENVRRKRDASALLLIRDEDDRCPRDEGPRVAGWVRELDLPFPSAVVLLYREYEVLFLPCVHLMAGRPLQDPLGTVRPGLVQETRFEKDPESVRGVKEWLSGHFPPGRSYKPTLDQLPMTRMVEFSVLREAGLPCFGTLERALRFVAQSLRDGLTGVYPLHPA